MPKTKARKPDKGGSPAPVPVPLTWLRARYEFHTFSYRDPRAAFSVAVALPVVSPTAVLLGICSTLYEIGQDREAEEFLSTIHFCAVKIDAPDGAIFFRAFHQLQRYVTQGDKGEGKKARIGFTEINQGTREYALLQGPMTIYVGVPENQKSPAMNALRNRNHVGTHDSLCSLLGDVEIVPEPNAILYEALDKGSPNISSEGPVSIVTLSHFTSADFGDTSCAHWRMAGGPNTDLSPFLIPGSFAGTRSGKIYRKHT